MLNIDINTFEEYNFLKTKASKNELYDIIKIGIGLNMPQETISYSQFLYYRFLNKNITKKNISFISSCFLLSSKITGTFKNLKEIIEITKNYYSTRENKNNDNNFDINESDVHNDENSVNVLEDAQDTELEMCIQIDFDFTYNNFYQYLKKKCNKFKFDMKRQQCAWILLNDSFYLPFSLFFSVKNIVLACIYITLKIDELEKFLNDDIKDRSFKSECDIILADMEIRFIVEEIIGLYENSF
ncbi:hypothetical protein CWI39_0508p0010 [Hamiltosporidium magnivora]|uniref:Cyclin n=1 Tax=Hamiltosporidium magnivora TaxID=148818 RepID=A0A4Q9LGR6_9MICR|nr:hypothetical protein CWI39_0508p0010 [Hamiltosporidium magnivora]